MEKCKFKNSYCHTCGKGENAAKDSGCFYDDPFWFPKLNKVVKERKEKEQDYSLTPELIYETFKY